MITYVYGDMIYSPARVLVNSVNTVGAMGAGLAYDFKRFYPDMFLHYRDLCLRDEFEIGQLYLYTTPHKWVLNVPTKKHWRAASRLEYIEAGLQKFAVIYAERNIASVSFPLLGTGSGGLLPDEVRPLMEAYLSPLPITVFIHIYKEDNPFETEKRNVRAMRAWLNAQPQHVTFSEFWRDLVALGRKTSELKTLDTGASFKFMAQSSKGAKAQFNSVKLLPSEGGSIFIPETQLHDLWQYVQRAGYILPQNLPCGLEPYAPYVVTLLAQLSYLQPVQLAAVGGDKVIGLHYIPPVERKEAARVTLS
jgi:O-acetyl-ADP-ribose deacetylase (regulator of RNase III)